MALCFALAVAEKSDAQSEFWLDTGGEERQVYGIFNGF